MRWLATCMMVGLLAVGVARGQVSSGLQDARRHFLDANVNVLTFHSIDQLFPTRRVETSANTWPLPRAETKLDFTYDYKGTSHPAADILDRTFTNALIIIKHGKIVSEIYRNETDASTHFISFSMAKSITSILIGLAVADGHIHSIDDQITRYVPELKDSAYDGVTIRQALQMRSGANYEEQYVVSHPDLLSAAFEESFVENRMSFVGFTRAMTRRYPPGEHFNYSTFETCVLGWVLERATKQPLSRYMTERLWRPAGMESYGFWMLDAEGQSGREFAGGGFNAVARDYARLGLMMLRNGKAGDHQVVPQAWVSESTNPGERQAVDPAEPNFSYGFFWWPLVDSSAYMARGLQGQYIFVDPGTDTVVVKLSFVPPGNHDAFTETVAFLQAASRWQVH
jgi:CubicO group peptidase (beta-lactamase class C family)